MRIALRRSVFLSVGLVVTGTLVTSDSMASPASSSVPRGRAAYHGRTVDREAIARNRMARRQRATRSGTRSRLVSEPRAVPVTAAVTAGDDIWRRLRHCETGGRYKANTGNGYYGAYQFSAGTWRSLGYQGLPHQAPPEIQNEAARKLQARSGWGQWPACSRRIGARR